MPSSPEQQEYARERLTEFLVENGVTPEVATAHVAKHVTEFDRTSNGQHLLIKSGDRYFPAPMKEGESPHWVDFGKMLLKGAPRSFNASAPGGAASMEELMERKRYINPIY